MAFIYERNDSTRRIVVRAIGPYASDDIKAVVDRQALEGTWPYGMLYDERG
jgi:hypothetical protein